jgi:iron complex outermembrane receptor protein
MTAPRMRRSALILLFAGTALPALAADDAFEFYKEEAQVVTASRRPEPARLAPAAVDVITADDIRAYGFKELWDILRFRAGMDVVEGRSLDGNRALVSARGFAVEFVDEMQVLVDGRSVYSPFLGGVYWQDLPVQKQDIERIEIVRGPNAALYGSNAGLGVINIITKKPGNGASGAATAWGGTRSNYDVSAAGESGAERAGARLSFETRAGDGHLDSDGSAQSDDFLHLNKVDARGRWNPDARTEVEVLGGGAWMDAGLPGLPAAASTQHTQNFESVKATRSFGKDSSLEATLSRSETMIDTEPLFAGDVDIRTYQYDAGLLHRSSWLDGRLKSNWGADWRDSGADSNQTFGDGPRQSSRLSRAFTQQSLRLADPLTLTAGISLEHSGTGRTQPAGQAALLLTPAEDHSLRFSYAYATTIPTLMHQHADYALSPTVTYVGNPGFGPEKIASWETGWNGRFLDGALKSSVSLYYMTISDYGLLSAQPSGGGILLMSTNGDRAFARGAELSADYALGRGRAVFANYTYERITNDAGSSPTRYDPTRSTPRHKANVGARAALPKGFTASAILGYKDTYLINSDSRGTSAQIPRHFRLDARLAWSPRQDWEVFVAGQELLQRSFSEYVDGTASPRAVRGGVKVRFGP